MKGLSSRFSGAVKSSGTSTDLEFVVVFVIRKCRVAR